MGRSCPAQHGFGAGRAWTARQRLPKDTRMPSGGNSMGDDWKYADPHITPAAGTTSDWGAPGGSTMPVRWRSTSGGFRRGERHASIAGMHFIAEAVIDLKARNFREST